MVRQYVGARYVSKFYQNSQNPLSNEWEANVTYEALTVVTYLNDSYTSKKPVPVTIGNPRDNAEYWCLTGAYNVQVEQYREEVQEYKNQIDDAIELVDDKIEEFEETSLYGSKKPNNMNKIFIIGDSYAVIVSQTTWKDILVNNLGLSSSDYRFRGEGGAGFDRASNTSGDKWIDFLESLYDDVIADPNDSINNYTHIIVAGGANDLERTASGVQTAILAFMTRKNEIMPNAQVMLAFVGNSTISSEAVKIRDICNEYRQICKYGNAIYLNDTEHSIQNFDFIGSDPNNRVHPNQAGSTSIGKAIVEAIRCGKSSVYINEPGYDSVGTISDKYLDTSNVNGVYIVKSNKVVTYTLPEAVAGFTANGSNEIVIQDYHMPAFPAKGRTKKYPIEILVKTGNTPFDFKKEAASIAFEYYSDTSVSGNPIKCRGIISFADATSEGYMDFYDITQIRILPFTIIDTL